VLAQVIIAQESWENDDIFTTNRRRNLSGWNERLTTPSPPDFVDFVIDPDNNDYQYYLFAEKGKYNKS